MDPWDETVRPVYRTPSHTEMLERDLAEAQAQVRRLGRELKKEQQRRAETAEAYTKTVTNLVRTVQENTVLRYEYERLKRLAPERESTGNGGPNVLGITLTCAEIAAIRKAMARLHHPDVGGDGARMQAWNVALDELEEGL